MGKRSSQFIIKSIGKVLEVSPRWAFSREIQMALDGCAAGGAVLIALLVRFEFNVSRLYPGLLFWIPLIAIARPLLLLGFKSYRSTWRHFHLADGMKLVFDSAPLTAFIMLYRASSGFRLNLHPLPYGVAIMEWTLFIGF